MKKLILNQSRGFTLVEMMIAIALLGIIMTAVFGIFATANKNYRFQSQKSFYQKELNFVTDALGNEIKSAIEAPANYGGYTRSTETLILAIPAQNNSNEIIYANGVMLKDYVIYTKEGSSLRKIVSPDAQSSRGEKNSIVLESVSGVTYSFLPTNLSPESVTASIVISKEIGKSTLTLRSEKTGFMRNKQ